MRNILAGIGAVIVTVSATMFIIVMTNHASGEQTLRTLVIFFGGIWAGIIGSLTFIVLKK